MSQLTERFFPGLILAAGLLVFSAPAYALQDADTATPAAKPSAEATTVDESNTTPAAVPKAEPVDRVKFEAAKTRITFKQKLAVYNRAKQDSDKLYCREDRVTGSHRKQIRCITYETKQREEDAARDFFRSLSRPNLR